MAQSSKRITRKDLRRPDQFVTFTGQLLDSVRHHRKASLIALAALAGAFLLYGAWDLYESRRNRLAAQQYSRALGLFHEQKYRAALEPFTSLSNSAPSTYRRLALLYLGNTYAALGEPKNAVPAFERLARRAPKPDYIHQLALLSLAQAHESAGNPKDAAKSYTAAQQVPGPFKQEAILGEGRTNAAAGNLNAALQAYRNYATSFPAAERRSEVSLRIRELESTVGKAKKEK
ncbi:MAG: tetratricopeptide repeat protein [Deltaproteobacteria bacterium]|nr:tetratricopeptide repeat protein [Deltaproteobacteria bacterium]